MVTAVGEGASAPPTSSTYGGGDGAGGKFTRNNHNRNKSRATPYNRPPTALRQNPRWISKLVVDPIRNLASSAAHRFFASFTGKRLTCPPPPLLSSESNQEVGDGPGEAAIKNKVETTAVLAVDAQNLSTVDIGGISELEQLLKHKNFSRSEIDRLTELLQSKAVNLPVDREVERVEAGLSEPAVNFEKRQQLLKSSLSENGTRRERSNGVISAPGTSARVLDEDVASPAELAKAYMDRVPSKVSPSMLGFRGQAVREEAALLSNAPFTPNSPRMSLVPRITTRVELGENSFTTTRSRGRSAIYNMARSPYSRFLPTASGKGSVPRRYYNDGYLLPSSASQGHQDGEPGSTKSAPKRRSSVLDDDLGSVGPVRRIRQKHNLSTKKLDLPTTRGIGSASLQQPLSLTEKLPLMDEWKHKGLKPVGENVDNGAPSTSYAHVPPKSSEMAAKILQHLEKMTPKEKSAESKLIIAREKSPAKLTTDMLHGQALRSLEHANSPKSVQGTQGSQRLEDVSPSSLTPVTDFTFLKQEKVQENGPQKLKFQFGGSTPVVNSNSTSSIKDSVHSTEGSDSAAKLVSHLPQKKRAFTMSAHEDYLDLDEDTYTNGPTSDALVGMRGKSELSMANHSLGSAEKAVQPTPALPEIKKIPTEPIFGKQANLEVRSPTNVGGEKIGVAFPALQTFKTTSPSETHALAISTFEKPKQAIDNLQVTGSSPAPPVTDLSAAKPSSWIQPTPENSSSSSAAIPSLEVSPAFKHDDIKESDIAKVKGKSDTLHSSPFSLPSATAASFVAPENSNLKNGPLSISSAILSTPAMASTGFANQTPTAGTSSSFSTNITNFATATWSSGTASSIGGSGSAGAPLFPFGSSVNPSTVVSSSAATTSDAQPSVAKSNAESVAHTSSLKNIPFGGSSFTMASTGSSGFGLGSLNASTTVKPQTESTASGIGFGMQSPDVGSGASTVSQKSPFQFGSSEPSPVFSTSGVSSFTSSNPLFSSSAPGTKMFGSGASFGLSSSTSSAETKPVDASSGPSSGIFNFGAGASAASSGASAFSLTGGTSSTFNFAASSSAASSLTNSVGPSSSTVPAIFNFAASSASGPSMASSSAGTNSGIFGSSTPSPSSETNAASSSGATSLPFGSSWQTPNSAPFVTSSSSSPSPVFNFGASSSSFPASNAAPVTFGSSAAGSSGPPGFSFTTASSTTSLSPPPFSIQPMFGNSTPTLAASGNSDQMGMEDSMAEDVQATTPAVPVFGQQPLAPSPGGFAFGSATPQSASPFQFSGQQSLGAPQNSSPFQASGSMEFNAGGSFSLGSGGGPGDKSNRRFVKVSRTKPRRK